MELDGQEALLLVAVGVDAGGAVDGAGVGPEDGEEGRDEPGVAGAALSGVIEVAEGLAAVTNAEHVDIGDQALVDLLEEVVVHVAP